MTHLVPLPTDASPLSSLTNFNNDAKRAQTFAQAQHASATRRAYLSDIRIFNAWCQHRHLTALPARPQTVRCSIIAVHAWRSFCIAICRSAPWLLVRPVSSIVRSPKLGNS